MPSKPAPAPHDWLKLDLTLDVAASAKAFGVHGRLHIPGVLAAGGAERLYRSIAGEVRWRLNTETDKGNVSIATEGFDQQPEAWRNDFHKAAEARAMVGFQYLFDSYSLADELEADRRQGMEVEAAYDLFNSPPWLAFLRRLTGDDRIAYVDAQATRYLPRHFLTQHDDDVAGKNRLYAYVLNLTPRWKVDWGGLLLFLDEDGHVAEGYAPKFNALNIFSVPFPHCVTQVATFAGAPRYAITGWIRSKTPW